MKLTVVSASYNALSSFGIEKIKSCIRSVAALPIEHEHLIYDGASTDGTVEVLNQFAQEIPSLKVVSEKDSGIYEALNKGLRDAKGEWFYVIGCDDCVIKPELIEMYVGEAEEGNFGAVSSPVLTDNGIFCPQFRHIAFESVPHPGLIMRTKIARALGGFDVSYRIAADYKMILSMVASLNSVLIKNNYFTEFSRGGTSGTASRQLVEDENARATSEVFNLSDPERIIFNNNGLLPLRLFYKYNNAPTLVARKMAIGILGRKFSVFRKYKRGDYSTYYLLNLPVYKHLKKSVKGKI